ncbi:MAG: undecaprenyl/decaprenyl-phosphate alpha-N-acetylglucosaminyl 1-phosphate transferase [Clostridiales Family XIII bacterium]|jgi:UDP-GlcNAc:undecaprenyl-phosphate GlcNAc-1-phosphate transferase|nr:undecaprenyl/decaprenyl-phosphate alpha-N-acetylglucosaminyl 1-phosphate transferase [Clostridiales Family XIII bacterium]
MTDIAQVRIAAFCCFVLAFAVAAAVTPLSMRIAEKIGAIDVPGDARRMHSAPVPRLGGLAIAVSFLIVMFICREQVLQRYAWVLDSAEILEKLTAVFIGGIIIFIVGLIDDMLNLKAWIKLIGQAGCAAAAFFLGVRIPAIGLFGWQFSTESGVVVSFIITVLWLVAITNMINLIDGLDGLAAGVSGIAAIAIAYADYIHGQYTAAFAMVVLAGAAFGFLPFNFFPAKVFMGDSGAMFLGFTLASLSIIGPAKSATIMATIAPVLVLGVPVFDVAFAMIRRRIRGKSIFSADKGHLHHQLTRIGMGQRRSVLMLYGISGIMGIAAIVFSRDLFVEASGLFVIAVVFIFIFIWGWNRGGE